MPEPFPQPNFETPTLTQEREVKYGITDVAVSYGLAQVQLEDLVFASSPTEWRAIGERIVDQYPALSTYREVFLGGVKEFEEANQGINNAWTDAQAKLSAGDASIDDPNSSVQGTECAKEILGSLKGLPREFTADAISGLARARVERGKISLTVWLEPDDYHRLLDKGGFDNSAGRFFQGAYSGDQSKAVPLIFLIDDDMGQETDVSSTELHESVHLKNRVNLSGYLSELADKIAATSGDEQKLFVEASRNIGWSDHESALFKEELDAIIAQYLYRTDAKLGAEGIPQATLQPLIRSMVDATVKVYTPGLEKRYDVSFSEDISKAFIEVRDHFIHTEGLDAFRADRACIKFLRVFPLESWAVAARTLVNKNDTMI